MNEALRLADALDDTPNWQKESFGSDWKSGTMKFDSTPFEAAAELRRLHAELERKSDAIQRLWKERDELRSECRTLVRQNGEWQEFTAELVEALRGTVQEMLSVVASLNAEQMPHDGDEFHERLEKARAALAKVEVSK